MNKNDVNCTKEPYCFASKDEDDRKNPLILSNSIYEYSADHGKYDDADEQQVVWKLKNDNSDDNCNAIFDTNFNGTRKNAVSSGEKTYLDEKQCDCILAWQRLKQFLELTDDEVKRARSSRYTFPEGIFSGKPVDADNDDSDESLDDFELDGEYLYAGLDGMNNYDANADTEEASTSSAKENTRVVMDERNGRPADVETIDKPAKSGRNTRKTNAHAEVVANNAAIVKKAEGNNSPNYSESALNDEKQQKSKLGEKTDKSYAGGKKTETGLKSNATTKKTKAMKYVYTYGETYRGGIQCGHVNCVESPITIPRSKGWITDEFIINERRNKLLFKSGEPPRPEKPTTKTATVAVAAAAAAMDDHHVVQRSKPKVVTGYGVGHSAYSVGGSRTRDVVAAAAASETAGGPTARDVAGGGPDAKEAAAALEFVKKNGTYTVTMNCLTSDGQLDAAAEPVVFRLAARTDVADAVSSSSSFDLRCVSPNAIRALRPTKTCKDAYTSYTKEDFGPSKH